VYSFFYIFIPSLYFYIYYHGITICRKTYSAETEFQKIVPWVRVDHDDELALVSGHVRHLDHGHDVPGQLVQDEEEDLRGLLGLQSNFGIC
jgi:hypothetical protein